MLRNVYEWLRFAPFPFLSDGGGRVGQLGESSTHRWCNGYTITSTSFGALDFGPEFSLEFFPVNVAAVLSVALEGLLHSGPFFRRSVPGRHQRFAGRRRGLLTSWSVPLERTLPLRHSVDRYLTVRLDGLEIDAWEVGQVIRGKSCPAACSSLRG